jgi:hypothetical protein
MDLFQGIIKSTSTHWSVRMLADKLSPTIPRNVEWRTRPFHLASLR